MGGIQMILMIVGVVLVALVAIGMIFTTLYRRSSKEQTLVMEDLGKNGLELETVSLTALDQTSKEFFNPDNAFDAAGLTMLTDQIESRRKQRNDIERDTQVAIEKKDLEAERLSLNISRDSEYARLDQQREVETRKAHQQAGIAQEQAGQERTAEEARITSTQQVDLARSFFRQRVDATNTAAMFDASNIVVVPYPAFVTRRRTQLVKIPTNGDFGQ